MKKPKFEFYTRLNGHTEFLEFYKLYQLKTNKITGNYRHYTRAWSFSCSTYGMGEKAR